MVHRILMEMNFRIVPQSNGGIGNPQMEIHEEIDEDFSFVAEAENKTFEPTLRNRWNKGISSDVTPQEIARYFQGVCLLCCTEGDSRERILNDIERARQHFEYFSVNVFCHNTTFVRRDETLVHWFVKEVYPHIKDLPGIEVLVDNTDLGVG